MPIRHLTAEEFAAAHPNSPFAGPQIIIGYRPNSAPAPELTEEQKALIDEFLVATKDADEASCFLRMFGTATRAWRRAIERGEEATVALRAAGITEDQISAYKARQREAPPTPAPEEPQKS